MGRERKVNLLKNFTPNGIWFIEYLNSRYDPFSLKLEGWANECREKIDDGDWDDTITRLVEKYESQLELPPELEFVGLLGLAGATIHNKNVRHGPKHPTETVTPLYKHSPQAPSSFHQPPPPPSSSSQPKSFVSANSTKLNIPVAGTTSLNLFSDLADDLKQVNSTIYNQNKKDPRKKKGVVVNL